MLGTTLGVLLGIAVCALLHRLFPEAASTNVVGAAIVATCGIIDMGLEVRGRTKM